MLNWISDHPWLSFFLVWPVGLTLAAFAWSFATMVVGFFNGFFNFCYLIGVLFLTLVRGYPPSTKETKQDEDQPEHPLAS